MAHYHIAWWNLENLFDSERSRARSEWLRRNLRAELKGWTKTLLMRKVEQLAWVISQMNNSRGPDLLGVAEVENREVLELLVAALEKLERSYQLVHYESEDKRGIDTGLIYDAERFSAHEQFTHRVLKRSSTRDLFQVNFKTAAGNELIVLSNHWPARRGGVYQTEPSRIIAAETLAYWHCRICEIKGPETPILVMGDFNDEPQSRSLTQHALSTRNALKIKRAKTTHRLFNLMWGRLADNACTFVFGGAPLMLDQFMISRGLLPGSRPLAADTQSVRIMALPRMTKGVYKAPRPFGRPASGKVDRDGFSDHFPITVRLLEE